MRLGIKHKTSVAILALLLLPTGSIRAAAAGGSVAKTAASTHGDGEGWSSASSPRALKASARPGTSCRGATTPPTRSNLIYVAVVTTCLIDLERIRAGLQPLQPNMDLQQIAASQAADMVIGDYFGDDSLSGRTPIQRIAVSHYAWRVHSLSIGQNIGWGTGVLATPQAMVEGWMHSPQHRRIILTAGYRDIGAGIAPSAPPTLADGLPGATYSVELAARH